MSGKPPVRVRLAWDGGLRFQAAAEERRAVLDGESRAGPSPVEALAFALAGCMAADVVEILVKGRQDLRSLHADLTAWRAEEPPRRLLRVELRFRVGGDVPQDRIERALELSREKYCSVWHSLRQDIDLAVSCDRE